MRIWIQNITLMDPDPTFLRIRIRNTACQQAIVPVLPAWAAEAGQSHLWDLPHAGFLTE
jgi:hypothetical protein